MKKSELRAAYKSRRQKMSHELRLKLDQDLLHQFQKMDLSEVDYLHTYLPIKHFNEPDTFKILEFIQLHYPDKKIVLSKSDFESSTITLYLYDSSAEISENNWGIPEPDTTEKVDPKLVDMFIIPLLVCDMNGNRIGYGKGFYDRLLHESRPDASKVGLSYFLPVPDIDDVESWDVPLDNCITPKTTFSFT